MFMILLIILLKFLNSYPIFLIKKEIVAKKTQIIIFSESFPSVLFLRNIKVNPMVKQLSKARREIIVGLYKAGKNQVQIASEMKVSVSTVSHTIKKYNETKYLRHQKDNGRLKKVTERIA